MPCRWALCLAIGAFAHRHSSFSVSQARVECQQERVFARVGNYGHVDDRSAGVGPHAPAFSSASPGHERDRAIRTSSGRPLLFTGFVVTGFVTTVLGPVLPWLTARWSLSDAAAGALFTIQFAGSIIAGALSGMIIARLGASTTLATGYALMAAGLVGLAFGDRLIGTSAMAIAGIGLGFVVPATNLMVARLTPAHAAAALGAVNLCWGIGAATWPIIVGRFNPVPGVHFALVALPSSWLLALSVRFPSTRCRIMPDAPPVPGTGGV